MKIIAKTGGAGLAPSYLVEVTEDEIALAAGFPNTWNSQWKTLRPADGRGDDSHLRIGAEIKIQAAYDFHYRVAANEAKAREGAATLRALASLLDGALPSVIISLAPVDDPAPTDPL